MNSGVYAFRNKINGHRYIGSSVDLRRRESTHRRELAKGTHHCAHLQRAYKRYGADAFEFVILEYVAGTKQALLAREQFWLEVIKPEYNTCLIAGSHLGIKRSSDARERMRQAQADPEVRRRKSEALKGKKRPEIAERLRAANIGKKHSEATKEKLSRYFSGRKQTKKRVRTAPVTEETREKLRARNRRMWKTRGGPSEETKKKISQTLTGRKLTDEQRAQRSASMKEVWKKRKESHE